MAEISRLKRLGLLLLIIALLIPVLSAAESQPTHGCIRVCGIKDKNLMCSTYYRYMPRAVMPDVYHMDREVYVKWQYGKVGNGKRIWSVKLVDADGELTYVVGKVRIYFPYLSVYSTEKGEYWKWSKDYSNRYEWVYCPGAAFFGDNWCAFVGTEPAEIIDPYNDFGFKVTYGHSGKTTYINEGVYIGMKDSNSTSVTITYNADRISKSSTAIGKVRILVSSANVREGARLSAERIGAAKQYETYDLLGVQDGWYKIKFSDSKDGYISASLAEVVE